MPAPLLRLLCLFSALSAVTGAQSISWDPPGGTLPLGQGTSVQLVLKECEARDTPVPPKVDGLALEYDGESSSMSWINGNFSRSVIYNYTALLSNSQGAEIPSFTVDTNKGPLRVAAVRFQSTGASVGGESLDSAANAVLVPTPETMWAGEVFDLTYRIKAGQSYYPNFGHGDFDWKPDPLITEDWSQPSQFNSDSGDEPQTGLVYQTRAVAPKAGEIQLNPATQVVNLSIGMTGLGFFQQRQYQQFSVKSNAPIIQVRALPPAPSGFTGAVGDFTLTSRVVPTSTSVGEPITWTLELKGTGNWPEISGLPPREVSNDFQVVQPKAKRTPHKLFDSTLTEDVVLIPTRPGTYELAPSTFVYFDPRDGSYKTLTAAGATVTIAAPPAAAGLAPGVTPAPEPGNPSAPAASAATAPAAPAALPRDALPDSGSALTPWTGDALAALLIAPFALLTALWLWLALRRARQTDPDRARREARARLSATLARIRSTPPGSGLHPLLSAWQRDAAIFLGIPHAAPSASQLGAAADWAALWSETERALYGPAAALPADWTDRAAAALAAKPAPAFQVRLWLLPRNLLPWAAALALCITALAEDGGSAYRRGDFSDAQKTWEAAIARDPANWSARHNLSLALAQQDQWGAAAAQAAAALVQQPGSEAVRWQFALASDKAGFVPEPLAPFLTPGPRHWLAALASPAAWQLALVVAAWLAAAAKGFLLVRLYQTGGRVRRWDLGGSLAGLGIAIVLALVSVSGWLAYGAAADARAAVTWRDTTLSSIPTEADTSQKTTPLAPGSLALADKSFLGWTRLSFGNGQTGWVRTEEIVRLWR